MSLKQRLHEIIFEADTPAGKAFDLLLIISIMLSVTAVMLDSVGEYHEKYGTILYIIEWFFTILFTVEYALRLWIVERPMKYGTSFFGIVDLLAVVPTYLSLFLPTSQYLLVIRVLRMLRIFRVLKLVHYVGDAQLLMRAMRASRRKIGIFVYTVLTMVVIFGALMYFVEGPPNGFTSIPRSMYWAIVTLTTVGYGDISPQTPLGQFLSSMIMILGYGIIAVPTGIFTVEMSQASRRGVSTQACPACAKEGHDVDAVFCKFCGQELNPVENRE
ncbi:MAG TPA: ion transporter [Desulfuromonadales bacterium]|nr:ion transporter [Desulfuromonadales bacterium]